MEKFIIYSLLVLSTFVDVKAFSIYPYNGTGYCQDFANVMSTNEIAELNSKLNTIKLESSIEIALVTIPQLPTDVDIASYANKLFREWGIGKAKSNNGILVILAIKDRKSRIEVGRGMEPYLTDSRAKKILDAMKPDLKASNYYSAFNYSLNEINKSINVAKVEAETQKNNTVDYSSVYINNYEKPSEPIDYVYIFNILFTILFLFLIVLAAVSIYNRYIYISEFIDDLKKLQYTHKNKLLDIYSKYNILKKVLKNKYNWDAEKIELLSNPYKEILPVNKIIFKNNEWLSDYKNKLLSDVEDEIKYINDKYINICKVEKQFKAQDEVRVKINNLKNVNATELKNILKSFYDKFDFSYPYTLNDYKSDIAIQLNQCELEIKNINKCNSILDNALNLQRNKCGEINNIIKKYNNIDNELKTYSDYIKEFAKFDPNFYSQKVEQFKIAYNKISNYIHNIKITSYNELKNYITDCNNMLDDLNNILRQINSIKNSLNNFKNTKSTILNTMPNSYNEGDINIYNTYVKNINNIKNIVKDVECNNILELNKKLNDIEKINNELSSIVYKYNKYVSDIIENRLKEERRRKREEERKEEERRRRNSYSSSSSYSYDSSYSSSSDTSFGGGDSGGGGADSSW